MNSKKITKNITMYECSQCGREYEKQYLAEECCTLYKCPFCDRSYDSIFSSEECCLSIDKFLKDKSRLRPTEFKLFSPSTRDIVLVRFELNFPVGFLTTFNVSFDDGYCIDVDNNSLIFEKIGYDENKINEITERQKELITDFIYEEEAINSLYADNIFECIDYTTLVTIGNSVFQKIRE